MPDSPDFDQLARQIAARRVPIAEKIVADIAVEEIAEQLRLVWNARGAADLAKIDSTVTYTYGSSDAGIVKTLNRALRTLDR